MSAPNDVRLQHLENLWAHQMTLPEDKRRSDLKELAQSLMELRKQCQWGNCPEVALTVYTMPDSPIKAELIRQVEDEEITEQLDYCAQHTRWTENSR